MLRRQGLLDYLRLEYWLHEGPKYHLVDYAVYSPSFLLVLEIPNFAGIHPQPKVSRIQNSNSTEIIGLQICFDNQIQTFLAFDGELEYFMIGFVFLVIEVKVGEGFDYFFFVFDLGDEFERLVLRKVG